MWRESTRQRNDAIGTGRHVALALAVVMPAFVAGCTMSGHWTIAEDSPGTAALKVQSVSFDPAGRFTLTAASGDSTATFVGTYSMAMGQLRLRTEDGGPTWTGRMRADRRLALTPVGTQERYPVLLHKTDD